VCGCDFERVLSQVSRNKHNYCSPECTHLGQRKVERPGPNELRELIQKHGYRGVGRMYGVSDNAVRKWLKVA
jgi:hypothetical protein